MKTLYIATIAAAVAASAFALDNPEAGKRTMLERTGGFIEQPLAEGSMVVSIVDRRKAPGDEEPIRNALDFAIHAPVVFGKADNAAVTVSIVDEGDFMVDPVKCTATVPGGKTAEDTKDAICKAIFCILSAESSILTQEGQSIAAKAMEAKKIPVARRTTYRKACEEGWAPAPTNDLQRAVWEEVKASATNAPAAKAE